jgi:hypothetical protein
MSLQQAAKHLERHGRNGDDMLVHMSRGEVKSLNDIAMAHGGQLTINPQTGLPEAGFLKSLLPMIAGAGLMAVSGGAINPMTAGLLVGGGTGLMTGDIKKGLVAGLGAYGGAGMASGLAASGTQAAAVNPSVTPPVSAAPVAPPVESVMTQPPPATPLSNLGAPPDVTQSVIANPTPTQISPEIGMGGKPLPLKSVITSPTSISAESLGYKPLTPAPNMVTKSAANAAYESSLANQKAAFDAGTAGERLSTMGKGAQTLTKPGGFSNFYENLANDPNTYGAKTTLAAAAAPTLAYAMEPEKQEETKTDSDPGQQYTYAANPANPFPEPDPYGRERRYFSPAYTARAAAGGMMASGGVSHLGDYSDGGRLLRGPGDGVSDSIPAVIGRKQPARLADGEFVIPARIVSELGNGSTEAGARKLYAMMDRIQKARKKTVGKGKVAMNSRSEKYLPA